MRGKSAAALAISVLVILAAFAAIFILYGGGSPNAGATRRASDYLVANYNPGIGMIPETPKGNTYFVYSDNFLASYVLGRSANSTFAAIASNITSTDARYLAKVPNPGSQYQPISSTNGTFYASNNYILARVGSAVIETTLNNGTATLSPASYADLAFLEALYWYQNHSPNAASDFNLGVKLFDGQGFKDTAFTGIYQTYKLALYDYVGKVLGMTLPSGLDANLRRLQAPDGGFYTGYGPGFVPNGNSTNTETTSLAILALSTTATRSSELYSPYPLDFALTAAVALAAGAGAKRMVTAGWSQEPRTTARFHRDSIPSIEV